MEDYFDANEDAPEPAPEGLEPNAADKVGILLRPFQQLIASAKSPPHTRAAAAVPS